jgi:hypothetical protein
MIDTSHMSHGSNPEINQTITSPSMMTGSENMNRPATAHGSLSQNMKEYNIIDRPRTARGRNVPSSIERRSKQFLTKKKQLKKKKMIQLF